MKFYENEEQVLVELYAHMSSCSMLNVLIPNVHDGSYEKHVPIVVIDNNIVTVNVAEIEHPMIDSHYIVMIAIETSEGYYFKLLKPGDKPTAQFILKNDESFVKAYEYCNIHSLWSN